jgi:serine/threonine-protein kinase
MIGKSVGNYRIVEKIGAGGVGEVYRAVDLMLERPVAIKVLRPEYATRSAVVERFRSEAQTLARLNHPNIATLFSFVRDGEALLMVMEFVEGTTLAKLVRGGSGMALGTALPLFLQALDAIGHAHELGIVHRDIKGSNLMLNTDARIKVMDFGIARMIGSERLTRHGQLVGTPDYMSPEQIRGEETDERSDIYALGVLLYEMLTGRVPFRVESEYALMQAHVEQSPRRPGELVPGLSEAIEKAILRALAKEPAERFSTTDQFRTALVGERRRAGDRASKRRRPADGGEAPNPVKGPSEHEGATQQLSTPAEKTTAASEAKTRVSRRKTGGKAAKRTRRTKKRSEAARSGAKPRASGGASSLGATRVIEPDAAQAAAWPEPAVAREAANRVQRDFAQTFTMTASAVAIGLILVAVGVNAIRHRPGEAEATASQSAEEPEAPAVSMPTAARSREADRPTPSVTGPVPRTGELRTALRPMRRTPSRSTRERASRKVVRSGDSFVIDRGVSSESRGGQDGEWVIRKQ